METEQEMERFIAVHRTVFPRHPYSPRQLRELMTYPGWNNFSAFQDDQLIGNIMLFLERENEKNALIEDLFVLPDWRRKGIGTDLLFRGLSYFRGLGAERVRLEMWSANKPAHALYRSAGFAVIDETEIALGMMV
jgi:GNAT superfamily N-acetyltransferase